MGTVLVFDENNAASLVNISIMDDDFEEPPETFTITLIHISPSATDVVNVAPARATVFIVDERELLVVVLFVLGQLHQVPRHYGTRTNKV